jgi:hypothetical protein
LAPLLPPTPKPAAATAAPVAGVTDADLPTGSPDKAVPSGRPLDYMLLKTNGNMLVGRALSAGLVTEIPAMTCKSATTIAAALITIVTSLEEVQAQKQFEADTAGQVIEVITTSAAVLETAHYQAELVLACSGASCFGSFAKPGRKRRLHITRMTCRFEGQQLDLGIADSRLILRHGNGTSLLAQYLPINYSTGFRALLNQSVDMQVQSNQTALVAFQTAGGTLTAARCTATGSRDTLQ